MILAFILLAALLVIAPAVGALTAATGPTVTARGLVITDRAGHITIVDPAGRTVFQGATT